MIVEVPAVATPAGISRNPKMAETLLDTFLEAHQDLIPERQLKGLRGN